MILEDTPGKDLLPVRSHLTESTAAQLDRANQLYRWNLPLLVIGFVCVFAFFGHNDPLVSLSTPAALGLGCLLWALALVPVVRYRSKTGVIACAVIGVLAIPLCYLGDSLNVLPNNALHGMVRAFPAGACLSVLALGGLARARKL